MYWARRQSLSPWYKTNEKPMREWRLERVSLMSGIRIWEAPDPIFEHPNGCVSYATAEERKRETIGFRDFVSDGDWKRFLEFSQDLETPNIVVNLHTVKKNFIKLRDSFPLLQYSSLPYVWFCSNIQILCGKNKYIRHLNELQKPCLNRRGIKWARRWIDEPTNTTHIMNLHFWIVEGEATWIKQKARNTLRVFYGSALSKDLPPNSTWPRYIRNRGAVVQTAFTRDAPYGARVTRLWTSSWL